jgi:hypothetical protein
MMEETAGPSWSWAIVELMGHLRLAGRISEEERFGAKMGRLDIPYDDGSFVTKLFGGGSVYSITYVSEAAARIVAKRCESSPIQSWELPKQPPVGVAVAEAAQKAAADCRRADDIPFDNEVDSDIDL